MGSYKTRSNSLILLLIISCFLWFCGNDSEEKLQIIHLEQFDSADTTLFKGQNHITKSVNFIIIGYHNNVFVRKKIDSFAFNQFRIQHKVDRFNVIFYNYSDDTNLQNLEKNPRDFYRYAPDDALFAYGWTKDGILIRKTVYDNGKIISAR